jgi:hypothetical protein
MKSVLAVAATLVLLALPAAAQSTADLQVIGQAAAQQYGVPWTMFQAQIQAESSWNPNIGCSEAGACGIAQFLASTASDPGYGMQPFDRMDPTAALNAAAQYDAALYQATGSWVGALEKYSGLTPTNPADYGSVFAAAAQADGGAVSVDPTGQGAVVTTSAVTTAPPATPFTSLWSQLILGTQTQVSTLITDVQTGAGTTLSWLMAAAAMASGFRVWFGQADFSTAARWLPIVAIVAAASQVNAPLYTSFVVEPVTSFPTWWQQFFTGSSAASPAAFFDGIYNGIGSLQAKIWSNTPWSPRMIWVAIVLASGWIVMVLSLLAMFFVFAILSWLSLIGLILGPALLPFALFERSRFIAWGWLWSLVTILAALLAVDIALGLYQSVMQQALTSLTVSGYSEADLLSFWGVALKVAVMGWSTRYVWGLVNHIGSGVSVGMDSVASHMSGDSLRYAAMTPVRVARKWSGV